MQQWAKAVFSVSSAARSRPQTAKDTVQAIERAPHASIDPQLRALGVRIAEALGADASAGGTRAPAGGASVLKHAPLTHVPWHVPWADAPPTARRSRAPWRP